MKFILTWLAAMVIASAATGALKFEQNKGQTSAQYSFLVKARGQTVFLGQDSLIELHSRDRTTSAVRMRFPGANTTAPWTAIGGDTGIISYFVGNNPSKWVREAHQYAKVERKGIYPGVDLVMYGEAGNVEYDLVLGPRADASRIRLQFDSAWPAKMGADGAIEVKTPAGTLLQKAPRIYQGDRPVKGRFIAAGKNEFQLTLGEYDHTRTLVVDPVIETASYYGGELDDQIVITGVDYVAGNTASVDFELGLGARRGRDIFLQFNDPSAFVNYYSASVTPLYYIFGGSDDDELTSSAPLFSNLSRNTVYSAYLYLAGVTKSKDLPSTVSGPGHAYAGGESDGFLLSISLASTGSALQLVPQMAYWGGSGADRIEAIYGGSSGLCITGSTTSTDLPTMNATQPALAGGKDAFVAYVYMYGYGSLQIIYSSYLGGSGDDTGWAVVAALGGIYIGGETRSPDFPLAGSQQGTRQGPSDGFFTRIAASVSTQSYSLDFSRLIGGSGDDAVKAFGFQPTYSSYIFAALNNLAIAGVTSSTDFPILNAAQPKLGGGTDAFAMGYVISTDHTVFSTYWGGTADDAATAATVRADAQFIFAGNTRSRDFPVKDPVQSTPGGGQDGFVLMLDGGGQAQFATYYGGSGDENVRSVIPMLNGPARIGGDTTSPDLPGLAPAQKKDDGIDGFTADIGVPLLIVPDRISAGKGVEIYITPLLTQTTYRQLIARTLDPSKVRLVDTYGNPADQVLLTGTQPGVYIEAQQDSGEGQVEFSVDGFPAKRVTVTMLPLILQPQLANSYTVWTSPQSLFTRYCGFNRAANRVEGCGAMRVALQPKVTYSSSNPDVANVGPELGGYLQLQFLKRGTATISLSSSDAPVASPPGVDITVTGVTAAPLVARTLLGKDLTTTLTVYYGNSNYGRGNVQVRSSDPSLVRTLPLVGTLGAPGGELLIPVANTTGLSIGVESLAEAGEATITCSSPDWDADVNMVVELRPSFLQVNPAALSVAIGATTGLSVSMNFEGSSNVSATYNPYPLRTGVAIPLRITSSDASIAGPRAELASLTSSYTAFDIAGKASGSAVLSVAAVPPAAIEVRGTETINVGIVAPGGTLTLPSSLTVGKDLQTSFTTMFSGNYISTFTVTVADPTLVLLSTSSSTPGTSQITTQNYGTVWVQALASSGSTQVSFKSADGSVAGTVTINLAPSGLGYSARTVKLSWQDTPPYVYVQGYALDPASGFPVFAQVLRPGVTATMPITTNGTSAAVPYPTFTISSTTNPIQTLIPLDIGTTIFTLGTPDGFSPVPRRNQLEVTVVKSALRLTNRVAVQNGMLLSQIIGGAINPAPIRFESGDPARLLLSTSLTGTGSASITVSSNQDFYLIGLAGSGSVPVHASATGYADLDDAIGLVPLTMSLLTSDYNNLTALNIQSGTQPSNVTISPTGLAGGVRALALGVTVVFAVSSSVPGVADVTPSTITLSGTTTSATNITVTGKSPGSAIISARTTGPTTLVNSSITVAVTLPMFRITDQNSRPVTEIGQNLVLQGMLSLQTSARLSDSKIVTVTSLNPDLLQVSRSSDATPAASTSVAFNAGSYGSPIYLQANAGSGTAQIVIKADGVADATIPVTVVPLAFAWNGIPRQIRVGQGANSAVLITSTGSYFRPGTPAPSLTLAADPPEAAVIAPATLTFSTFLSAGFSIAPTTLGNFDVVATLPDGSTMRMPVQALPRVFGFNCGGRDPIVGQDLYITCSVTTSNNVPASMTSEDPSQLVVSSSETSGGAGNLLFDTVANAPNTFYAQALGSTGQVNVVFQAPGYDDLKVPVVLQKTGVVVTPNFGIATAGATQLSGPVAMTVSINVVNSSGQVLFGVPNKLRPGVAFAMKVTSSDPAVVVLDTGSIQFQSGDQQKVFNLKPGKAGTSVVTITSPAAYPVIGNLSYLFEVK